MKAALVVVVLAAGWALIESALLEETKEKQLDFYRVQVHITSDLLVSENCSSFSKLQQQKVNNTQTQVDELREFSDHLLELLASCRSEKSKNSDEQTTLKPANQTSIRLQPTECQYAVNYTESWRRDHLNSNYKPKGAHSRQGYACDLGSASDFWFRFKGEAGNRMLNKCPKFRSCGTKHPLWTDREMPQEVGVETEIKVYGVDARKCKSFSRIVKAIRCSWDTDYDIVFKQVSNFERNCYSAFCGMI